MSLPGQVQNWSMVDPAGDDPACSDGDKDNFSKCRGAWQGQAHSKGVDAPGMAPCLWWDGGCWEVKGRGKGQLLSCESVRQKNEVV
jgi:hypothetical protein